MADVKGDLNQKYTETENGRLKESKIKDTTVNGTKLTDINQYCLEHIFSYLKLGDLLNVTDANNYLKTATYVPFVRNYAGKSVEIDRAGHCERILEDSSQMELYSDIRIMMKTDSYICKILGEKDIVITDLKAVFQLLRCFGEMITDLKFVYDAHYNNKRLDNQHRIVYYINEFCSKSLNKLESELFGFENLEKPFIKLEDLTIVNETFYLEEQCLSKLFPKLCRLCVRRTKLSEEDNNCSVVLSQYFPNLNHLNLGYEFSYYNVDISALLRLNPQLRSFEHVLCYYSYLDRYSEYLQFIESLEILIDTSDLIPENSIYFNNVKRFNITIIREMGKSYDVPMPKIPLLFRQLKEFEVDALFIENSDFFLTFLSENPMIEKLTFDGYFVLTLMEDGRLQQALPSLKHIFFKRQRFAEKLRIISDYLPYMGFLETVNFSIYPDENLDELSELCANEWRLCRTRVVHRDNIFRDDVTLERI